MQKNSKKDKFLEFFKETIETISLDNIIISSKSDEYFFKSTMHIDKHIINLHYSKHHDFSNLSVDGETVKLTHDEFKKMRDQVESKSR